MVALFPCPRSLDIDSSWTSQRTTTPSGLNDADGLRVREASWTAAPLCRLPRALSNDSERGLSSTRRRRASTSEAIRDSFARLSLTALGFLSSSCAATQRLLRSKPQKMFRPAAFASLSSFAFEIHRNAFHFFRFFLEDSASPSAVVIFAGRSPRFLPQRE